MDATLRDLSTDPRRAGRGRPQLYDGTVALAALARWDRVATADEQTGLSQAVVPHGQLQRRLRVVVVVDLQRQRQAVLCSTEVALPALTRSRDDKARFQIELLGRDAKQCPGLTDGQARSRAKRHCPFKASLTAVSCATLTVQPQTPARGVPFSMAHLKRRAFNQHLLARIIEHLAYGGAHPLIF